MILYMNLKKGTMKNVVKSVVLKKIHFMLLSALKNPGTKTLIWRNSKITTYTVGTESIQTPLHFSLFVILQPFAKII